MPNSTLSELASQLQISPEAAYDYCVEVQGLALRAQSYKSILKAVLNINANQRNQDVVATTATRFHDEELSERARRAALEKSSRTVEPPSLNKDFLNRVVAFTGDKPFASDHLKTLVAKAGADVSHSDPNIRPDFVVIGRQGFNANLLRNLVTNKARRFLSQEDFLNHLLFDIDAPYHAGDVRIEEHPGLRYLSTVGMKWPSLVGETDAVLPLSGEDEWPEESELKRRFGYSVRKGISITDRRACLKKAVEKHDGLTAHGVAEQIARLIKINQHRHDTRMDDAIDRWRADFNWFQVEFGKNASSWPHI